MGPFDLALTTAKATPAVRRTILRFTYLATTGAFGGATKEECWRKEALNRVITSVSSSIWTPAGCGSTAMVSDVDQVIRPASRARCSRPWSFLTRDKWSHCGVASI